MRRRFMTSEEKFTHLVRTTQKGTIEVYVNDSYVGTISSGRLEWKAPKYSGTVKIELKGVESYTSQVQASKQLALIRYERDNSLAAYLKPYEKYEAYDAALGSSMLSVVCYLSYPVTVKQVWNPNTLVSTSQQIINIEIPPTITESYIIDTSAGGSQVDAIENIDHTYNGELYQYSSSISFGRGYGKIDITTDSGVAYYINITD